MMVTHDDEDDSAEKHVEICEASDVVVTSGGVGGC